MESKSDYEFVDLILDVIYDTYKGDTIYYQCLRYAWLFLLFAFGYKPLRIVICFLWAVFVLILSKSYQTIYLIMYDTFNIGKMIFCQMIYLLGLLNNLVYSKTIYYHHHIMKKLCSFMLALFKENMPKDFQAYNEAKKNKGKNNDETLSKSSLAKQQSQEITNIKIFEENKTNDIQAHNNHNNKQDTNNEKQLSTKSLSKQKSKNLKT